MPSKNENTRTTTQTSLVTPGILGLAALAVASRTGHASKIPGSVKAALNPQTSKEVAKVLSKGSYHKRLTEQTINPHLAKMQYAVRGKVVIAADEISKALSANAQAQPQEPRQDVNGHKSYPFDKILYTNVGNPHSVGQKPLTWPRQVMALVDLPDEVGVDHPDAKLLFPKDAIDRAREIKKGLGGVGTGSYSHSQGVLCFREDICNFIEQRDGGVKADPDSIFMTNGASSGIVMMLQALISNERSGVMIPIPQYPIYSATIDLLGGKQVGYYLDENKGWEINLEELERSYMEAKANGIDMAAFVLINPGNPTGQVLSREALHDICRFCSKHELVLLADEVYQENIYDENSEFVSCKRAAYESGLLQDDAIELVSFHSTSKGVFGECGRRGGYMELVGIDPTAKDYLYKLASSGLCSGLPGQLMTSLMTRGPTPGTESFKSHEKEKANILNSLKKRSKIVGEGLDSIPGFSCQKSQGAMYCFPSVEIPKQAIEEAEKEGLTPDTLYALSLLEETGICVVPASGFRQKEGRYGFRTTFLPPEDDMADAVDKIKQHYIKFCSKYE